MKRRIVDTTIIVAHLLSVGRMRLNSLKFFQPIHQKRVILAPDYFPGPIDQSRNHSTKLVYVFCPGT